MNNTLRKLAAGAAGYIEKPIDPDTFVNEIREYLKDPAEVNK